MVAILFSQFREGVAIFLAGGKHERGSLLPLRNFFHMSISNYWRWEKTDFFFMDFGFSES